MNWSPLNHSRERLKHFVAAWSVFFLFSNLQSFLIFFSPSLVWKRNQEKSLRGCRWCRRKHVPVMVDKFFRNVVEHLVSTRKMLTGLRSLSVALFESRVLSFLRLAVGLESLISQSVCWLASWLVEIWDLRAMRLNQLGAAKGQSYESWLSNERPSKFLYNLHRLLW